MIDGFSITLDFVTEQGEQDIVSLIDKPAPKNTTGRNSIQRFGSGIPYKNFVISNVIPDFLDKLSQRLLDEHFVDTKPDSVSINEYLAGQKIVAHIDSNESGKAVAILSLLSPATMKFTRKHHDSVEVALPPRSLVILRGEARYDWSHSIAPVKSTRYSIVFRGSKP